MLRLIVVLAATAALAAPTAAAAKSPVRHCGNYGDDGDGHVRWTSHKITGAGTYDVDTRRARCVTGRRVALSSYQTYPGRGKTWRYGSWSCHILKATDEVQETRCTKRGGYVVHWQSRV
jgi:hypothetical protein